MASQVSRSPCPQSQAPDPSELGPIEFKQELLCSLNEEAGIMDMLRPLSYEVVILYFEGVKYILLCDPRALPRPQIELGDGRTGDDIYCYCQLEYTRDKGCQVLETFTSTLPKHSASAQSNGDIFLPLGSLLEPPGYGGNGYVCMFNISTNPISMWATCDYHDVDTERTREYKPMTRAKSAVWGLDLILLYEDIKDWHPNSGSVAPWTPPGKEMYSLGNTVRGHSMLPPKDRLDAVTQDWDSNDAVKEGDAKEHAPRNSQWKCSQRKCSAT